MDEPTVHHPPAQQQCPMPFDHDSHFWSREEIPVRYWCAGIEPQQLDGDELLSLKLFAAEMEDSPYRGAPMLTGLDELRQLAVDQDQALPAVELAEVNDDYMRMLDPERPWLMLTSDGHAWIQCAECDTWIQVEGRPSHEEAALLAEIHRVKDYPHVLPPAPTAVGKRHGRQWWKSKGRKHRKLARSVPRQIGGRRCPECGINEVNDRCMNIGCVRNGAEA